ARLEIGQSLRDFPSACSMPKRAGRASSAILSRYASRQKSADTPSLTRRRTSLPTPRSASAKAASGPVRTEASPSGANFYIDDTRQTAFFLALAGDCLHSARVREKRSQLV